MQRANSRSAKVKRNPDAAVASTVQSLIKNQQKKRMFVFSLRTLGDLCTPPNIKYKENSVCVLEEGGVQSIKLAIEQYIDDEELMGIAVKVLWGVSEGLKDEPENSILQKAIDDGAVDSIIKIISAGVKESSVLLQSVSFIENMSEAGIDIDPAQFIPGLLTSLTPNVPPECALSIVKLLAGFGGTPVGATVIGKVDGAEKLLKYALSCTKNKKNQELSLQIVEYTLICLQQIATAGHCNTSHLEDTIAILEFYKGRKSVVEKGSSALAAMLGPGQLKTCLDALSKEQPGSQGHNDALTMLSSISYIGSYAEAIVKSNGVPLLVGAVQKTSAGGAANKNPKTAAGVTGACKMLDKIAAMPQHIDTINKAGTAAAMVAVLKEANESPECCEAALNTIASMSLSPESLKEFEKLNAYQHIFEITKRHNKNPDVSAACMNFIKCAGKDETIAQKFCEMGAIAICCQIVNDNTGNLRAQTEGVAALATLSKAMINLDEFKSNNGPDVAKAVLENSQSEEMADAGTLLYSRICHLPGMTEVTSGSAASDALLACFLNHASSKNVSDQAIEALELVATEKDVAKVMGNLEKSLSEAKTNPDKALQQLAAVNGLARVSKLRKLFEEKNASQVLLKGGQSIIESPQIKSQQKLVSACVSSTNATLVGGQLPVDDSLLRLLNLALLPQMKALIDKQDASENNLLDILLAAREIAAVDRIGTSEKLSACIEAVDKISRKYPERRRVQVVCLEILNELVTVNNGEGIQIALQLGVIKQVLQYMQKVIIYEDVQIAGTRFLLNCCQNDKTICDAVRGSGGLELCKASHVRYSKNKELQKYLSPLMSILMPEDQLEREIQEALRNCMKASKDSSASMAISHLKSLINLTATPEGSKIAASNNVFATIKEMESFEASSKVQESDKNTIASLTAQLMKNIAATQPGAAHLAKNEGAKTLVANFGVQKRMKKDHKQAKEGQAGQEANMWSFRQLMKRDEESCTMFAKHGMLTKICQLCEEFPDDEGLLVASCGAIAASKSKDIGKSQDFVKFVARILHVIELSPNQSHRLGGILALEELLRDADDSLLEVIVNQKGLTSLYNALDKYSDDKDFCRSGQRCIDEIARYKNPRTIMIKEGGEQLLAANITVVARRIINSKDANDATANLRMLNRLTDKLDKKLLMESGVVGNIQELMISNPENTELSKQTAILLSKLDPDEQVKTLIAQILKQCKDKPAGYNKNLTKLNNQLAGFLTADLVSPDKTLEKMPEVLAKLAEACANNKDDSPLLASSLQVSRRVTERLDSPKPFGKPAAVATMFPQFCTAICDEKSATARRSKNSIIDGYYLGSGLLVGATRKQAMDTVHKTKMLAKTDEVLDQWKHDPAATAAIFDFMAKMASDSDGANALVQQMNVAKRRTPEQLVDEITAIMKRHRTNAAVTEAGFELLGNLIENGKPAPTNLGTPAFIKSCEQIADGSPEALAAYMKTLPRFVKNNKDVDEVSMVLKRVTAKWNRIQHDVTLDAADKGKVAGAAGLMMAQLVEDGHMEAIKAANGITQMMDGLESNYTDAAAVMGISRAIKQMSDADSEINAMMARRAAPLLMSDGGAACSGDIVTAKATLEALSAMVEGEGNGAAVGNCAGFPETMTAIEAACEQWGPEGQELLAMAKAIRAKVADDNPDVLTLKQMFEKWSSKKDGGETLNMAEAGTVLQQFDFVSSYTEEYSKEQLKDLKQDLGNEFMYGCKCFMLLHEYKDNTSFCLEVNEHIFMLNAIRNQKNDEVGQYAVLAGRDACAHPVAAKAFSDYEDGTKIAVNAVERARGRSTPFPEKEEMIIPRLVLIERMAVTRNTFNGTNAMKELIGLWDDYDAKKYSVVLLRHMFHTMRMIVNDTFVEIIQKNNVPKRLVDYVNRKDADLLALPDVLFLIGVLAMIPDIKNDFGDLKCVEGVLDLIRKCLKNKVDDTAPVQTNACLALSNVCIGHGPNISRFVKDKGVELNVTVMEQSMVKKDKDEPVQYDVANAASVLMCNLSFKRDDMKEIFGKKKAPAAVMHTIQQYDGSDSVAAFRCLQSMFKAIANLALFTPNVEEFLDNGVELTFEHFYNNSSHMPDNLLAISLRTMSNLVLENTEEAMTQFGVVLEPILQMIQQSGRVDTVMYSLAFEILGNLCRLPENGNRFAMKGGIPAVLKVLNSYEDSAMYRQGIYVLGIQTTNASAIPQLVDHGIFTFLVATLENQLKSDQVDQDITLSATRCVRRMLKNKAASDSWVEAGGVNTTLSCLDSLDAALALLHMEQYRNIIALLELNPSPAPEPVSKEDDEWTAPVKDEEVLRLVERLPRPPSPRSWEQIGLEADKVSRLLQRVFTVLDFEQNTKQSRLWKTGVGLIAYFACEKIKGVLDAFYERQWFSVIAKGLETYPGDVNFTHSSCYAINNICYVSDPALYGIVRADEKLRPNLSVSCKAISSKQRAANDFCSLTRQMLEEKRGDPEIFADHMQWDFPFDLTEWNNDPYPNGVQDLPQEIREKIRKGDKIKTLKDDGEKETLWWKASMDMEMFQWRVDPKEGRYPDAIGVSRFRNISRGPDHPLLAEALKKGKVSESSIAALSGESPDYPAGVAIPIVAGSKKDRDKFLYMITEWRDAATMGF